MEFIVRCRGLPYSISKREIEKFFDESQLRGSVDDSIHITYNDEGRPSGECFIEFNDEDSYHNAKRKHKQYLGSRYVELFDSDSTDMNKSLMRGSADRSKFGANDHPVVKMRGLPYGVTESEVHEFFTGLRIVDLKFRKKMNGELSGEAYARFQNQAEAVQALDKHHQCIGHRYIEIFKATGIEMENEMSLDTRKPIKGSGPRGGSGLFSTPARPGEHKILMRGIPFDSSEGDIIKFFAPLMPRHVELISEGGTGRPSGTAHAFFNCHEDAVLAMEKDKEYMGSRYVELFMDSAPDNAPTPLMKSSTPLMGEADAQAQAAEIMNRARGGGRSGPPPARSAQWEQESYENSFVREGGERPARKRLMAGAPNRLQSETSQQEYTDQRSYKKSKTGGMGPKTGGMGPKAGGMGPKTGGIGQGGGRGRQLPAEFQQSYQSESWNSAESNTQEGYFEAGYSGNQAEYQGYQAQGYQNQGYQNQSGYFNQHGYEGGYQKQGSAAAGGGYQTQSGYQANHPGYQAGYEDTNHQYSGYQTYNTYAYQ